MELNQNFYKAVSKHKISVGRNGCNVGGNGCNVGRNECKRAIMKPMVTTARGMLTAFKQLFSKPLKRICIMGFFFFFCSVPGSSFTLIYP